MVKQKQEKGRRKNIGIVRKCIFFEVFLLIFAEISSTFGCVCFINNWLSYY